MIKVTMALLAFALTDVLTAQQVSVVHDSNLRSTPSTKASVEDFIPAGRAVRLISKYPKSGYIRIQTIEQDKTGWVLERNVDQAKPQEISLIQNEEMIGLKSPEHRIGEAELYSNPQLTPGRADPTVTQDNIAENICSKNWSH